MPPDLQPRPLAPENFRFMQELLRREAAIQIEAGKEYLVETRLAGIATRRGFASINAVVDHMRLAGGGLDPSLQQEAVEALTTNETLFFRDLNPFDALREHVIPEFRQKRPTETFTLWSAACSTGQEPYSIAMLLAEHFGTLKTRILATDLASTVLTRAKAGSYQQIEVNRGLPAKYLIKYFRQNGTEWQLQDEVRRRVEFRELNLIRKWPLLPACHVVMLRNVLIYFDVETRREILRKVRGVLAPGGYLVLGGSETTLMMDSAFKPVPVGKATFYQAC